MPASNFVVDVSLCTRCGLCVKDCPAKVIEQLGKGVPSIPERLAADCIECQHCLAVCPVGAVSIFGLKPENSAKLRAAGLPSLAQEELLARGRRSVRQYHEKAVDKALVDRLLAATAHAPTGCNSRTLTFTLVDGRDAMKNLLERLVHALENALHDGRVPEGLNFLAESVEAYRKNGEDPIFRSAPHLLIVSAPATSLCKDEDVAIALSYFELLAASAGLGAGWCGFLKIILSVIPEFKKELGIAEDAAFYGMLFGTPAVSYPRTVQRDADLNIRRLNF